MNQRALGIVRVSNVGGREGESFVSPGEQRGRIGGHCQREGWELIETIDELDVSGGATLERRKGLTRAIETIESGKAEVLIVANFDRLVRSLKVQDEVVTRVEAAGGRVLALDFGQVTAGTAAQWLSGTMIGAVSEYYRRSGKERSAAGQQAALSRGVAPWPSIIVGYRRDEDGRLVLHEPEAKVMREAFRVRADGATTAEVADHLRANGIERNARRITKMLASRTYLGELHFGKLTPNIAAHEPLIDEVTFNRVQRYRAPRGRQAKSQRILARLGILLCGTCGARMTVQVQRKKPGKRTPDAPGKVYYHYVCDSLECPRRVGIIAPVVEEVTVNAVRAALAGVQGRASAEAKVQEAERALETAQAGLDRAIQAFAVLGDDEPAARDRLIELKATRDEARVHLERLGGQGAAVVINGAADWNRLSYDEKRLLIRATVLRVTIAPGGSGAERVTVELLTQ